MVRWNWIRNLGLIGLGCWSVFAISDTHRVGHADATLSKVPLPCKEALEAETASELKELSGMVEACTDVKVQFTDALIEAVLTRRLLGLYHGYDSLKPFGKWEAKSQFWTSDDTLAPVCNPRCGDGVVVPKDYSSLGNEIKSEGSKSDSGADVIWRGKSRVNTNPLYVNSYPFPGFQNAGGELTHAQLLSGKFCQIIASDGYSQADYDGVIDEPNRCSDHEENWATIRGGTMVEQAKSGAGGGEQSCEKNIRLKDSVSLSPYYSGVVAQATWSALSKVVTDIQKSDNKGALSGFHPSCRSIAELYLSDLKSGTTTVLQSVPDREKRKNFLNGPLHSASRADLSRQAAAQQQASGDDPTDLVSQLKPKVEAWLMGMKGASLVEVALCEIHENSKEAVKKFSENVVNSFGSEQRENPTLHQAMMKLRDRALVWCSFFPAEECDESENAPECRKQVRLLLADRESEERLSDFHHCVQWHFTNDLLAVYEKMDGDSDGPNFKNEFLSPGGYTGKTGKIGGTTDFGIGCKYERTSATGDSP